MKFSPNDTSGGPNLMALYGQALNSDADMAQIYENPVVDNIADFSTHGTGKPYEFYDSYEGPLTGRGQPAQDTSAVRQPQTSQKMAQLLLAKMQEKQQTSQQYQQSAQQQNKQNAGPSGY